MVKWNRDHLRDRRSEYKSLCGLGYDWPSTISLKDKIGDVDCIDCRRLATEGCSRK